MSGGKAEAGRGGHVDEGRLRRILAYIPCEFSDGGIIRYAIPNAVLPLPNWKHAESCGRCALENLLAAPLSASEAQPTGDIEPWLSNRCRGGWHDKCRHSICDCECHKTSAMTPEEKEAQPPEPVFGYCDKCERYGVPDCECHAIAQEAQRRSFTYGNTKLSNERVTREMVDQEAEKMAEPKRFCDVTMKMRGRPVTHEEALESAQRLINSHFGNPDQARISIPVRPENDDVIVMDYILEHQAAPAPRDAQGFDKELYAKCAAMLEEIDTAMGKDRDFAKAISARIVTLETELAALRARAAAPEGLREALAVTWKELVDIIVANNLGDPDQNPAVQIAVAALAASVEPGATEQGGKS